MLLGPQRQRQLCERLLDRGSIRVGEAARLFGVSDETIRRDIKALVKAGFAEAVFGGAVLRSGLDAPALRLPPVGERVDVEAEAKAAIGAAAAARVGEGAVVILDAGTTTLAVARHLRGHRDLTIVTNSLVISQVMATSPTCTTYVIGGRLVPGSLSMVGPQARRELAQITADWAFLGAAAISPGGDFASADPDEAEVKQAMIRAARSVVIVADGSKFETRSLVFFAGTADVQILITTKGTSTSTSAMRSLRKSGLTVETCITRN